MAGELQSATDGTETDSGHAAPLEVVTVADPAGIASGVHDAAAVAAEHGGNTDELSGAELTKLRDKIRKWEKRNPGQVHPQKHLLPPVGTRPPARPVRPLAGKDPAPIPASRVDAHPSGVPESPAAANHLDGAADSDFDPMLDWTVEEVSEISDEIIEGVEEWDKLDDVKRAKLANLPQKFLEQVEADAGMPKLSKKIFKKFIPKFAARKLNEARINPKQADGALITLGLLIYGYDKFSRRSAIAKEIKLAGGVTPPPAKPEDKK